MPIMIKAVSKADFAAWVDEAKQEFGALEGDEAPARTAGAEAGDEAPLRLAKAAEDKGKDD
jgi:heme/copper-type cytochrome/quinol oxidase subunit 2